MYIDSHTHIDFPDFDQDLDRVLNDASYAGIEHIIVSATTAQRWGKIKKIVDKYPQCHAAYGLHPMFMSEHKGQYIDELTQWVETEKPVAIGEIGIDFFIENPDKEGQVTLFIEQLKIADAFTLPVIIHARKSLDIILKHLRQFPNVTGSIHSFSGSEQQAQQCIDLGFYLGFGGPITYSRATRLRKLVTQLPLDCMLIETDSPDQPDASHFSKRNEPAYLPNIATMIAELRGITVEEVAKITHFNAQSLFKLT